MKKLLLFAVLAVVFISTPVMAREGAYFGVGIIGANILSNESPVGDYDAGGGYELRIGHSFGSIALELNAFSTRHTSTIYVDSDLTGVSVDLRVSFSETHDPSQVYLLAGLGAYSFENTVGQELTGSGVNLGGGIEHFFNEQVALDLRGVFRFIDYDSFNGYLLTSNVNGDTFTLGAALNLYF